MTFAASPRMHPFFDDGDCRLAEQIPAVRFLAEDVRTLSADGVGITAVQEPDERFGFLHETAVIEFRGVLYAAWYACPEHELQGYTPICERRSRDGGRTWSELRIVCEDGSGRFLYCPPVYAVENDTLYLFVNRMIAPDHIHSLDLYRLNPETDRFEEVWSRPVPFKLNTGAAELPGGKRMLPGRMGILDGFPNTPAVLISDDGRIDTEWRMVKIAENGDLPDGEKLVHPELTVLRAEGRLYMFCRNDRRRVPLVYISEDAGETWSGLCGHDLPYISSKIFAGTLSDGRHYLIANIDRGDRSRLAVYFTENETLRFTGRMILFDAEAGTLPGTTAVHYPAACEADGFLYVIATRNYGSFERRGAVLFRIPLRDTLG